MAADKYDLFNLRSYWSAQNLSIESKDFGDQIHEQVISELCGDLTNKRILDIGCGTGKLTLALKSKCLEIQGLDISEESVKRCEAKGIRTQIGDARCLPYPDKQFDVVYSLGVVEHFKETLKSIEEHARVTVTGGTVLVAVPNLFSPFSLSLLMHLFKGNLSKGFLSTYGKRYSVTRVKQLFVKAGLKPISYRRYYGSIFLRALPWHFSAATIQKAENLFIWRLWGHLIILKGIKI